MDKSTITTPTSQPEKDPATPTLTLRTLPRILWLFTESDFATFVLPDTIFGISASLSQSITSIHSLSTSSTSLLPLLLLLRTPLILLSNYLNLVIFALSNQHQPLSIIEDGLNKPWRPIPCHLISAAQTKHLLLFSLPCVLAINYLLDVWQESCILFTLSWMYNDLGAGDDHFLVRNTVIALAFALYNEASLRIAMGEGGGEEGNEKGMVTMVGWRWIVMVSAVIFTTMHVQDMKDKVGDMARGRYSAPIALGDGPVRWTIAIPVAVWSFACPAFWKMGLLGYILPVGLGFYVVFRILWLRNVKADRRTWQIWTAWTACLYLLPAMEERSVLVIALNKFLGND